MAVSRTSFKKGNAASAGVTKKPGRPPDQSKKALRDLLLAMEPDDQGVPRASMRDAAIRTFREALDAKDPLGNVATQAVNAAAKILAVTDPESDDDPAKSGHVTVTVKYEGGIGPTTGDLPPLPARGTGGGVPRRQTVQRGAVRATVGKDDRRRA